MPKDKKLHLLAGLALSLLAGLLLSPLWGLVTASVIGALKELIWDWLLKKGTPELLDFVATVGGRLDRVYTCQFGLRRGADWK